MRVRVIVAFVVVWFAAGWKAPPPKLKRPPHPRVRRAGTTGPGYHRAARQTHDAIAQLLVERLVHGPRAIDRNRVHFGTQLSTLPQAYGLRGNLQRTPDIIAHDAAENELLVIEVAVAADAELRKRRAAKKRKYADLTCEAPADPAQPRVPPPVVVVVGINGTVPASTREAFSVALRLSGEESTRLEAEMVKLATARPDSPIVREQRALRAKADELLHKSAVDNDPVASKNLAKEHLRTVKDVKALMRVATDELGVKDPWKVLAAMPSNQNWHLKMPSRMRKKSSEAFKRRWAMKHGLLKVPASWEAHWNDRADL